MRFARSAALGGVGLLWWGFGPLVLAAAAAGLVWRPLREWLRPTRRVVLIWAGVLLALSGLLVVVPDGRVPIPTGSGAWLTPSYVGRPSGVRGHAGPVGAEPTLRSRWYGVGDCTRLLPLGRRLAALCGGDDPTVRLVDAGSLRPTATVELPGEGCAGRLAAAGGRLVAASARRLVTLDGRLRTVASVALPRSVRSGDCVAGLGADERGRAWFVTRAGVAGVVVDGRARTVDLDDRVDRGLATFAAGAYVAGRRGLHRLELRRGRPVRAWTSAYDEGERGSAPVVLAGGLVAVADNRQTRMQVVLHRADSGTVVCRTELYERGAGRTDDGMVAAGPDSVLVQNSAGYRSPLSTLLGRTSERGLARVDAADGRCRIRWTLAMNAPGGAPAVSTADGVAYAWTKRHSWWGVDAWYLSAITLDTGRLAWARRGGLGWPRDPQDGPVVLGPGRAAYVPVVGGIVRVADRQG